MTEVDARWLSVGRRADLSVELGESREVLSGAAAFLQSQNLSVLGPVPLPFKRESRRRRRSI
jgi:hypothetical protein